MPLLGLPLSTYSVFPALYPTVAAQFSCSRYDITLGISGVLRTIFSITIAIFFSNPSKAEKNPVPNKVDRNFSHSWENPVLSKSEQNYFYHY